MNTIQRAARIWVVCVWLITIAGCQQEKTASQTVANGEFSACDRATKDAAASIAAGKLVLKQYPPLPSPPGHSEYTQLLRERCNVEYAVINDVPEGVSRTDFSQEVKCWNQSMKAAIRQKHGEDIFTELRELAKQVWQASANPQGKQ